MEILQTILSSVTTLAALITASAAIIAPIRTASIQAETEIKLKELDLFQAEKAKAYKQLTEALGACRNSPSSEDADRLYEAISLASIYSSEDTAHKLVCLAGYLLNPERPNSMLYSETMAAMRDELAEVLENPDKVANRKDRHKKS